MGRNSYFLFLLLLISALPLSAQKGFVKRADRLMSSFRFAEAAALYTKEIKSDTNDLGSVAKLANTYYLMGEYTKCETIYAQLTAEPLCLPVNWFYYGQVLCRNAKYAQADMAYKKFAALMPDDSRAIEFRHFAEDIKPLLKNSNEYELDSVSINTSASEIAPNYYQQHFIFASNRDSNNIIRLTDLWSGKSFYDLYEQADTASPAIRMKGKINTLFNDGPVSFSANGMEMILTRTQQQKKGADGVLKLGLFHSVFDSIKKEWVDIQSLTFNSTTYNVTHPALSKDGNTLFFVSDMPGGFGETDIYKSIKNGGVWSAPVNLDSNINTKGSEMFPFLANDSVLYFSTDGRVGLGGLDIYSAHFVNGHWSAVQNEGAILNSAADDFGYMSDNTDSKGFFVSNRTGGKGSDDIYSFGRKNKTISLIVTDAKTNTPLENAIINLVSDKGEHQIIQTEVKGELTLVLEHGNRYKIEITKPGYLTYKDSFYSEAFTANEKSISLIPLNANGASQEKDSTAKLAAGLKATKYKKLIAIVEDMGFMPPQNVSADTALAYYNKNIVFDLPNIYFELNSSKLSPLSERELDNVAQVLKSFPELVIELGAYTDSRGSAELNINLSTKRAEACVNYLISKGIDHLRLQGIGYGENLIRNKCTDGVPCTESEHAVNRRTEFKVIKFD